MIKNFLKSGFCLIAVLLFTFCSNKQVTCVIKGKTIGRNSDTLILQKATEDVRFAQIRIPIKDSTFEYRLVIPATEAYELVFADELKNGSWRPMTIFPENGVVQCVLYPQNEFEKNQINGGELNAQYSIFQKTLLETYMPMFQPLNDSILALINRNKYFSPAMDSIQMELQKANDNETRIRLGEKIRELQVSGDDLSHNGKALKAEADSIKLKVEHWKYDYIEHNPTLVSYFLLLQDLQSIQYTKTDLDYIKRYVAILSKEFPDHPYGTFTKYLIDSQDKIKVGGSFIDFSLPDIDGKMFTLSELIKGKFALIDLWASWCSPCIMTSRNMIPVYEEFKDKGFIVCGVAAEINNTDQMRSRIEKEKYPWINLVDLDHKNLIWYKYGIPNAGGRIFLVDNEGKLLAINPTVEEVRNILIAKLKHPL